MKLHEISEEWGLVCNHLEVVDCQFNLGSPGHRQEMKDLRFQK